MNPRGAGILRTVLTVTAGYASVAVAVGLVLGQSPGMALLSGPALLFLLLLPRGIGPRTRGWTRRRRPKRLPSSTSGRIEVGLTVAACIALVATAITHPEWRGTLIGITGMVAVTGVFSAAMAEARFLSYLATPVKARNPDRSQVNHLPPQPYAWTICENEWHEELGEGSEAPDWWCTDTTAEDAHETVTENGSSP